MSTKRVTLKVTLEIDTDAWYNTYGQAVPIEADVLSYVDYYIKGSAASDEGCITTVSTVVDEFDPAEWSSESELTLEAMRAELEGHR